jgi:thiol:disulfide interchange protein
MIRPLLNCTFLLLGLWALFASPVAYAEEETLPIKVELISENSSIQPGQPFWVGIHLTMKDGWHTYWKNPGDAGMAAAVTWDLPKGLTASSIVWPTPEEFTSESLTGYGYHNDVLLMAQITADNDLISLNPAMNLKASVRWLVCSDSFCMPGDTDTSLTLPISRTETPKNQASADLFAKTRELLPQKISNVQASFDGKSIEIDLPLSKDAMGDAEKVFFFPEQQDEIDHDVVPVLDFSDSLEHSSITLKAKNEEGVSTLKGIVALATGSGDDLKITKAYEIDTIVVNEKKFGANIAMADAYSEKASPSDSAIPQEGFGMALLLAFVGGLILNLMPCVLPVISFKVLSFVKMAGQCRTTLFKHGLSFSSGVLVSFWILAGVLLLLQTYGHAVGWGFQLQEPLFVAGLAAFLLAFAFSLFGVYEVGNRVTKLAGKAQTHATSKREGHASSFLSGVLATAVATPCTGPFLGTVVGLAITLSPVLAMLLFTSMGVGMASPYLLLALFPGFLKYLPKPGPWMDTFKQLMGFVMLATVIWLTWVFGAQTNNTALTLLLISFFLLGLGCWIFGKWGSSVQKLGSRLSGIVFTAICFAVAGYLILTASASASPATGHEIVWEHYSPERVEALQKEGKPILIDFTAKWCLTCQANRIALTSEEVEKKFADLGVVTMEADWTKNDPVITQALRKYGRNGVPLYLLFSGTPGETPTIMPQLLTTDVVLDYLKALEK